MTEVFQERLHELVPSGGTQRTSGREGLTREPSASSSEEEPSCDWFFSESFSFWWVLKRPVVVDLCPSIIYLLCVGCSSVP